MRKEVMFVVEIVAKAARDVDLGDLAKRLADASLDYFEEKAARTQTTWDDAALRTLRQALNIPEFDGTDPVPEAPQAVAPDASLMGLTGSAPGQVV